MSVWGFMPAVSMCVGVFTSVHSSKINLNWAAGIDGLDPPGFRDPG
jgi:hypothetical protein